MQDMSGKVVMITGAGRGQGRSHAIRLAEAGASIIAFDICAPVEGITYAMASSADLDETAELVRATGADIYTARVDVRDFDGTTSALGKAVSKFGGLDVVVANAGVLSMERATEITQSTWDTIIAVNLTGTQKTIRASLPSFDIARPWVSRGSRLGRRTGRLAIPGRLRCFEARDYWLGEGLGNRAGRSQHSCERCVPNGGCRNGNAAGSS
ncbi:NAD(P)-dependent dehydrogenase (short-subunit alcohol dehydrogenase family) [Rhizobium beringeri]